MNIKLILKFIAIILLLVVATAFVSFMKALIEKIFLNFNVTDQVYIWGITALVSTLLLLIVFGVSYKKIMKVINRAN